jgi:hypothetical protein
VVLRTDVSPPPKASCVFAHHVSSAPESRHPHSCWPHVGIRKVRNIVAHIEYRLGHDCGGAGAPWQACIQLAKALRSEGFEIRFRHVFSSDHPGCQGDAARAFLCQNGAPEQLHRDMVARTSTSAMCDIAGTQVPVQSVDIYSAGWTSCDKFHVGMPFICLLRPGTLMQTEKRVTLFRPNPSHSTRWQPGWCGLGWVRVGLDGVVGHLPSLWELADSKPQWSP